MTPHRRLSLPVPVARPGHTLLVVVALPGRPVRRRLPVQPVRRPGRVVAGSVAVAAGRLLRRPRTVRPVALVVLVAVAVAVAVSA